MTMDEKENQAPVILPEDSVPKEMLEEMTDGKGEDKPDE